MFINSFNIKIMKKIIEILIIAILLSVLVLIVIFVFNPYELRTKMIGNIINSFLTSTLKDYKPLDTSAVKTDAPATDKNPLLNADQEKMLENLGVDVSALPTQVTPAMQACFIEKLGEARALEIVKGATPTALEFFKTKSCLGL